MRHSWAAPVRFRFKTERACRNCDVVKVTRHENERHWIEFWRGLDRIEGERTPPCLGVKSESAPPRPPETIEP